MSDIAKKSLGLLGYESYTFVVENLERSRAFYTQKFDFREIAHSSNELIRSSGQESAVFAAGEARVVVTTPLSERSAAARYLRRHPAGICTLSFRVKNLDQAREFLAARDATFLDEVEDVTDANGRYRSFSIATALGDVAFRFVERTDFQAFAPGFDTIAVPANDKGNKFGIERIDHVTGNARTMAPLIAFYRDVLGFEQFWKIQFHTQDVSPELGGTGLKSLVMWDRESGVKFASNEPLAPAFEESQIAKYVYDNQGAGIQHIAFSLPDIIQTVGTLRDSGVGFLSTPPSYFKYLPERLAQLGIHNVKEELSVLEKLEILVDGEDNKYMLQIFLREASATYDDERAGPFFYEVIQRAGDEGFGYGNFRALFESIERDQRGKASPPG
jgi:4-hydroxyphenylpyruvate dioxygenase